MDLGGMRTQMVALQLGIVVEFAQLRIDSHAMVGGER